MTSQKEFENYFKGQINWKEFNYILDIITEYQDKGIDISLSAVVHIKSGKRYDDVYLVDSNGSNYTDYSYNFKYRSNIYDEIVEHSKTEGIIFMVRPDDFRVDTGPFKDVFKQIQGRLSNRFNSMVTYTCLIIRSK